MSLSLTASFPTQQNLVIPLAPAPGAPPASGQAVRVASNSTGQLGILTATGAQNAQVNWSITGNPSWITMVQDSSTLVNVINFQMVQTQLTPYQFYVTATDGFTTVFFPLFIEVRDPFTLASATGATVFNVPSYDAAYPDIVFQGFGLNGQVDAGVQFILPTNMPPGMNFITFDGSKMALRPQDPNPTAPNPAGGITLFTNSAATTQVTLQAFEPGTMYDNPDRAFTQEVNIQSLTAQAGILDLALACNWNLTDNGFALQAYVDFLQGLAPAVTFNWIVSGTAAGTVTNGGTSTSLTMVWVPTGTGTVQFTFQVLSTTSGAILGQVEIAGPGGSGIPCSAATGWNSTAGVKIEVSNLLTSAYVGAPLVVAVSTPAAELANNETVYCNFTVVEASSQESVLAAPAQIQLSATTSSVNVTLAMPASGYHQKWMIQVSAENALSNPSRTGYAVYVVESNALIPMNVVTASGTTLTSVTGTPLAGISLSATNSVTNAAAAGVTFSLQGAPAGLSIENNKLNGNPYLAGVYTFLIVAEAANYLRSYSAAITLTVTQAASPLTITPAVPAVTSVPDGQQFAVDWGYSGTPQSLTLIQGYTVRNVLGTTEVTTSQVGSSVFTVYGESYYGDAYSTPAIVISSSITSTGALLNAPTIGTLDEYNNLILNWQPAEVNGTYQAYKGFNIWLSAPLQTPILQTIAGGPPTGLEPAGATPSSRLFDETLTPGDWVVSMQALSANFSIAQSAGQWDSPHQFPTTLATAAVTFDHQTVSLGQSVTITLSPNYTGANTWAVFFADGTTSGWMPLSIRSVAKAFSTPGPMDVIIQTQNDYSSGNPPVKLRRQATKSLFVMDQQYGGVSGLAGSLGFGGSSGFEITNESNGLVPLAPYEVVVRALVRDVLTNEFKLLVATARTADASSLLGTMALDVFPLVGRPRSKEHVDPALYLDAAMATIGNPVQIATAALPNAIVGKPINDFPMQTALNSGVPPFSWYVNGLPPGLEMSINGIVSGTAMTLGTTLCDFVVLDANVPPFIATVSLALTVATDLTITTTAIQNATVNTIFAQQLTQTGGLPPYTWTIVNGNAPLGLTLDPNTGILGGVPVTYNSTSDFLTPFTFTVQITDAIGAIATAVFTSTMVPASLTFGPLDQQNIFVGEAFRLRIPIFGGKPPYRLTSFLDQGAIGPGLDLISPSGITVVGVAPPALAITTTSQQEFPPSYPALISVFLGATGGIPPYQFSVVAGVNTNLPSAAVYGDLLAGLVSADGTFVAQIQVTDSLGETDQSNISISCQQQNGGTYAIKPVSVALNAQPDGTTNPANWTVTPIAALPDAKNNVPYSPAAGSYYGMALYQGNVLHMTQSTSSATQTINLSTGLSASGLPWGSGSQTDANWQVFHENETTVQALTVAPGQPDWGAADNWINNDGSSNWICRSPLSAGNSVQTYALIRIFDLTGFSLANTTIAGSWAADASATLNLNGNVVATATGSNANALAPFTIAPGSPYVIPGVNTLAINLTSVGAFNGARLTGTVEGLPATTMNFTIRAGQLPTGIVPFSGNSYNQSVDYSGIELFNIAGGFNASINGSYSFQAEFSNIVTGSGTVTQAVERASITVTTNGGGTTPVVVITAGALIPLSPAGSIDQHWTLTQSADSTNPGPNAFVTGGNYGPLQAGQWIPNGPDAQWIVPSNATDQFPGGLYIYQTTFSLEDFDPTTATLFGAMSADDDCTLYLNGNLVFTMPSPQFASRATFTLTTGFVAGINTVVANVTNGSAGGFNPTGLRLALSGTATNQSGQQQIGVFGTGISGNAVAPNFTVNLTTASGTPAWYYPLTAEGGTGPYSFQVLTGTTLPGATIQNLNGLPALVSNTTVPGSYTALISAVDQNGIVAAPAEIQINIEATPSEPIHIVAQSLPASLFQGRVIAANTYFVESDLLANFSATGLPPGVTLTATSSTMAYLAGTPTLSGSYPIVISATSLAYNTVASTSATVAIVAQSALFLNPPSSATLGQNYRVATNSAIIFVQYSGWLPTDAALPLPSSQRGTLGAPGVTNGGLPTTGVLNQTATGFTMAFDYSSNNFGTDVLTLAGRQINIAVGYPAIVATGKTVGVTVSEYSQAAVFAAPVTVTGGLAPYAIALTGFSDPRFTATGQSSIQINASQFPAGTTANCSVSMLVTDQSTQQATAVGVLQVTIQHETYIQVAFSPGTWRVNISSGTPFTSTIIPNQLQSQPLLGHSPYQFYVDQVIVPVGLFNFVTTSPSNRVLAIQFNSTSTSATVSDVDPSLNPSGSFTVPAISPSGAPVPGTYQINLVLRVVDSQGYSSSSSAVLSLVIS